MKNYPEAAYLARINEMQSALLRIQAIVKDALGPATPFDASPESRDARFLLKHGWARIEGTRKRGPGGVKATAYWRDPFELSLEPMQPQAKAIAIQRRRLRDGGAVA